MAAVIALDIDGTLIDLAGPGSRAMKRAFRDINGSVDELPTITFAGRTDRAIVRTVFTTVRGTPEGAPDEAELAAFFDHYLGYLPEEIERTPYKLTPGATELVDALVADPQVRVGFATGNIRAAARLKLQSVGIDPDLDFGAFGDEAEERPELVGLALQRGAALLPPELGATDFVVGDTPHDIDAARALGATAVAVAAGPFTEAQLAGHRPAAHLVVATLAEALQQRFWATPGR